MNHPIKNVYIDDGGVMNHNTTRSYEYQRFVAELFTFRSGGERNAWMESYRIVFASLEKKL